MKILLAEARYSRTNDQTFGLADADTFLEEVIVNSYFRPAIEKLSKKLIN